MKNTIKVVVTGLLVVLMAVLFDHPSQVRAQETNTPTTGINAQRQCNVVIFIVIVAGGVYIAYKLYQCAKKALNPPPPPPPPNPPDPSPSTNHSASAAMSFDDSGINIYSLSVAGNPDYSDGYGNYWTELAAFQIQTSTNFVNWEPLCTVTSWISAAVVETLVYTNGVPIYTNLTVGPTAYGSTGNTNLCDLPITIWNPSESRRFFRTMGM